MSLNQNHLFKILKMKKFDFDFSLVVISAESFGEITKIIKSVSEIKDAIGEEIKAPFTEDNHAEHHDEVKEEKKKQIRTAKRWL